MAKATPKKPLRASRVTVDKKTLDLATEKLLSSGLSLDDARELGIDLLPPATVASLHPSFKPLPALRLNYYDVRGNPLSDWPSAPPFYRLRYLEAPTDFAALAAKKTLRYVQEPATAPAAYYPRTEDWVTLAADVDQPLVVTEGELKAAKACVEGFPTIGLGGVYNWRALGLGITWLASLDEITWLRRNVYLCFDSDYRTNPMVCSALRELANEFQHRGAYVSLVALPSLPGLDKVGLDDFLVHAGPNASAAFAELLHLAEPLGLSAPLWELNDRYVYVRDHGLLVDQRTNSKCSPSAFTDHLQAPLRYRERVLNADGSVSYKPVSAASSWLRWPLRTEVAKLTYQPGRERFIRRPDTSLLYNIWPGWGVEPKKGDVTPFLTLLKHLFTGADPGALEWFMRWCAFPIQYPGTKLFSSAVLHGVRHGTGKSLVGYTLGRIYGENFTEITERHLHSDYNEWAEGKQLILGDDVTGSQKRQDADYLKKIITQRELRINIKYVPAYVVPDVVNYYFTANQPDSFFLEDDDRRFFIQEVVVGPLPEEFYVEYELWLETGGAEAVFDYLLKLDLADFNPAAPAFKTSAKERMTAHVRSDLGDWVHQLLLNPDFYLRVGEIPIGKDLFTSKELLLLYDPDQRSNTTANGMGRELARAGVRQVVRGAPVRLSDGSQARYYAIRNAEKWEKAKLADVQQHLNIWLKRQPGYHPTKKY